MAGNIFTCVGSHTYLMLQHLLKPRTFVVRGQSYTVGSIHGVSNDVMKRVSARMAAWVALVTATLRAEFPEWEVLQCFSVLNLGKSCQLHDNSDTKSFERLAQTFAINNLGGVLQKQAERLRPRTYLSCTSQMPNCQNKQGSLHVFQLFVLLLNLIAILKIP